MSTERLSRYESHTNRNGILEQFSRFSRETLQKTPENNNPRSPTAYSRQQRGKNKEFPGGVLHFYISLFRRIPLFLFLSMDLLGTQFFKKHCHMMTRYGSGLRLWGLGLCILLFPLPSMPPQLTGPPSFRCRANMAHVRQSRPDSGLGFQAKVLKIFSSVPSSFGPGVEPLPSCQDPPRCRAKMEHHK